MPTTKDLDALRSDVGETRAAYEAMKRGWEVYKNLGTQGYDLLAVKEGRSIRIEVKTTDTELRTGQRPWQLTTVMSDSEVQTADFLVYVILDLDTYFIIPRSTFPRGGSVTVNLKKDDPKTIASGSMYEPYRNAWDVLGAVEALPSDLPSDL